MRVQDAAGMNSSSPIALPPATRALQQLAARPDPAISLAEGALLIAKHEYPDLDIALYLERLDELAARTWVHLARQARPYNLVASLNHTLFEEEGFSGDTEHYYDPHNNFLNDVMERREGIPITLSILYLEVGRRLGLPLEGVSFPGHFLVKLPLGDNNLVILDPFFGGMPLGEATLMQRLERAYGGKTTVTRQHLAQALRSASHKDILLRLLRNLRGIYLHAEDWHKLLSVLTQILVLRPELAEEWRDRGALFQYLECARGALGDFRHYLELEPQAEDLELVEKQIAELEDLVKRLH